MVDSHTRAENLESVDSYSPFPGGNGVRRNLWGQVTGVSVSRRRQNPRSRGEKERGDHGQSKRIESGG